MKRDFADYLCIVSIIILLILTILAVSSLEAENERDKITNQLYPKKVKVLNHIKVFDK